MSRGLRAVLLALLFSLLAGFVLGTLVRLHFERPVQYLGAADAGVHQGDVALKVH